MRPTTRPSTESVSAFRFRLEKVRRIRQGVEDRAREELAASLTARRESEEVVASSHRRVGGALDVQRRVAALSGASSAELIAAQAYLERVESERSLAERVLGHHEESVEERRAALADAARDRQAMDRLRERRLADHAVEAGRAAAATLDELALRVHSRRVAA